MLEYEEDRQQEQTSKNDGTQNRIVHFVPMAAFLHLHNMFTDLRYSEVIYVQDNIGSWPSRRIDQ